MVGRATRTKCSSWNQQSDKVAAQMNPSVSKGQFVQRVCLDPRKSGRKIHTGHCSILYHFSFVCVKYCPIIGYLGSKDSSHNVHQNYAISFFIYLHLVLHAWVICYI